jgi:hypothetical protein
MLDLFRKFTGFFKPNFIYQHEGAKAETASEKLTPKEEREQELAKAKEETRIKLEKLQEVIQKGKAEEIADKLDDIMANLTMEEHETLAERLEDLGLIDVLEKNISASTKTLIGTAENDGTDKKLLEAARAEPEFKEKNIDELSDLQDAMEDRSEEVLTELKETLMIFSRLNSVVNEGREDTYEGVPEEIKGYVAHEKIRILAFDSNPITADDIAVANFMRADRVGREDILKNPQKREELFQAIANITTHYPKKYKNLKLNQITGNRNFYRKTVIAMAIVSLAHDSRRIAENLYKGPKEEIDVESEAIPPDTNFDFLPRYQTRKLGYVSKARRDGFTAGELAKIGLAGLAGFTLIANAVPNIIKGDFGSVIRNPYALGSAGILYLFYNPTLLKTIGKQPEAAAKLWVHDGLTRLSKKYRKMGASEKFKIFVTNSAEFDAMEELKSNGVKSLVEKARKRAQKEKNKPIITAMDLEEALGKDKTPPVTADSDNKKRLTSRMRFDFYVKLYNKKKNIGQLQRHCKEWTGKSPSS